jgi:hypothetical protein
MVVERALDRVLVGVGIHAQRVPHVNALDHQHTILVLDLAASLARQPALARIDATRFQRAPERASQSAGRRSDDVIERRRPLSVAAPRDAVMVGDLVVDAEPDRLVRPGKLGAAQRAADPLDADPRDIDNLGHVATIRLPRQPEA